MNGGYTLGATIAGVIYGGLQESKVVARPYLALPPPKGHEWGWGHCLSVSRLVVYCAPVPAPFPKAVWVLASEQAGPGEPCARVLPCRAPGVSRHSFVRDVGELGRFAVPVGLKFDRQKGESREE